LALALYVCYGPDRYRILCGAAKETKCQELTHAPQQKSAYSISSSAEGFGGLHGEHRFRMVGIPIVGTLAEVRRRPPVLGAIDFCH
jgi:hypothetical protein